MTFDAKEFAKAEWEQLKTSKLFKLMVVAFMACVLGFITQLIQGNIHSLDDVKFWGLSTVISLGGIFARHTWAGIEAKLDAFFSFLDPEQLSQLKELAKKQAQQEAVKLLQDKHPEAAKLVQAELEKKV